MSATIEQKTKIKANTKEVENKDRKLLYEHILEMKSAGHIGSLLSP